ncbi:MAG: arginyltransferase [Alphaproteobacteria bacterium]|nr:arginyltransferase [Alphaproteobacteria bacterium]
MSVVPSGLAASLRFFLSKPSPCPYVANKTEQKLFTCLEGDVSSNADINGILCRAGFRRSQDILYRPVCESCDQCVPVRVPVRLFVPSRSLRRVAARNADLTFESEPLSPAPEMYNLFAAYQQARHKGGDMERMTDADFSDMLLQGNVEMRLYALREASGKLKGALIADVLDDGYSAVYSFFDPSDRRRSLGTALVLRLIELAEKTGKPFVYLGYWIEASRKMSYKARFRPLQWLGPGGWDWLEDDPAKKPDTPALNKE